jgi:hypothetical protein
MKFVVRFSKLKNYGKMTCWVMDRIIFQQKIYPLKLNGRPLSVHPHTNIYTILARDNGVLDAA